MRFRVVLTSDQGQKEHAYEVLRERTLCGIDKEWLLGASSEDDYYQVPDTKITCRRCLRAARARGLVSRSDRLKEVGE
jgi:hypothetical protein